MLRIYQVTQRFPVEERYGLQAQIRRAAVSAAGNIVEGSARRGTAEYLNFLNIAAGSAAEARYLIDFSCRLGFLKEADGEVLGSGYKHNDEGHVVVLLRVHDEGRRSRP